MATTGAIAYFAQGKTEELGPGDLVVDAGSGNKIEKEQALDVVNAGEDGGFHGLETAMFRR